MSERQTRSISIGAVPYEMSIVDGGVLFSNKCGFWGVSGRFMFEYKSNLWYLTDSKSTWNQVPAVHLVRMHEKLCEYVAPDHAEADGSKFNLQFVK